MYMGLRTISMHRGGSVKQTVEKEKTNEKRLFPATILRGAARRDA
jgi:hypothetical protein